MSIVTDFKAINSRLRGDDWWEPAKPEPVSGGNPPPPSVRMLESDEFPVIGTFFDGDLRVTHYYSDYDFRCTKCGAPEPVIRGPIPVGGGSCGMTTAAEVQWKLREATQKLLDASEAQHRARLRPILEKQREWVGAFKAQAEHEAAMAELVALPVELRFVQDKAGRMWRHTDDAGWTCDGENFTRGPLRSDLI